MAEAAEKKDITFGIKGTFREGEKNKKFTKNISAVNEGFAKEKLYCAIGSKHNAKRRFIKIEGIEKVQ